MGTKVGIKERCGFFCRQSPAGYQDLVIVQIAAFITVFSRLGEEISKCVCGGRGEGEGIVSERITAEGGDHNQMNEERKNDFRGARDLG